MISKEEHKKLLNQIAEAESNSTNYFDVEKEFFLIDSENLAAVQTKLYGYSIQASGIYEDDNLTEDAAKNLDGRGCYVYVEVRGGQITISQDLNGSWGIYLFRHGDYFALSNSFFRLLDHLKFHFPLTLNRDYCHYQITDGLCSHAYSETCVNEIELLDRGAIILIDTAEKVLAIEIINYKEHSVPLNSTKGIAILDRWLDLWSGILRGVAQNTRFISADLTGGFDSRISLVPLLNSRIDLNKVRIHSIHSKQHTFAEDYAIASQIADHYGFKLNQPLPQSEFLNYTLADVFNFNQHCGQTFSNMTRFSVQKRVDKLYSLSGFAGEMLRNYWYFSPARFMEWRFSEMRRVYSNGVFSDLSHAIENIVKSGVRAVCDKYKINDPNSPFVMQYFYQETRCRHHFGKGSTLPAYPLNVLHLSPALDPEIRKLQLHTQECPDPNLFVALIFTRYAPDLLKFPFQGNRFIAPETLAYAKELSENFPRRLTADKIEWGGIQYSAA